MYNESVIFLYFWKEKMTGSLILLEPRLLGVSFRVCFGKKKSRAIRICLQTRVLQMSNMCKWAGKLPQNSIFLALPLPGILLPGDPGGVKRYEWHFWTPAAFCDLGQQVDLYTETILVPRRCWTFKNYDRILISLPPSLILAIYVCWNIM